MVPVQMSHDPDIGSLSVHVGSRTDFLAQTIHYAVFDLQRHKARMRVLRVLDGGIDCERAEGGEVFLPGYGPRSLVEPLRAMCLEVAQRVQNALGNSGPEANPHRLHPPSGKPNAPAILAHALCAQLLQLLSQQL